MHFAFLVVISTLSLPASADERAAEPVVPPPRESMAGAVRVGAGSGVPAIQTELSLQVDLELRRDLAIGLRGERLVVNSFFDDAACIRLGPTLAWRPGRADARIRGEVGTFLGVGTALSSARPGLSPHLVVGLRSLESGPTWGAVVLGWIDSQGGGGATLELQAGWRHDPAHPADAWIPAEGSPPLPDPVPPAEAPEPPLPPPVPVTDPLTGRTLGGADRSMYRLLLGAGPTLEPFGIDPVEADAGLRTSAMVVVGAHGLVGGGADLLTPAVSGGGWSAEDRQEFHPTGTILDWVRPWIGGGVTLGSETLARTRLGAEVGVRPSREVTPPSSYLAEDWALAEVEHGAWLELGGHVGEQWIFHPGVFLAVDLG